MFFQGIVTANKIFNCGGEMYLIRNKGTKELKLCECNVCGKRSAFFVFFCRIKSSGIWCLKIILIWVFGFDPNQTEIHFSLCRHSIIKIKYKRKSNINFDNFEIIGSFAGYWSWLNSICQCMIISDSSNTYKYPGAQWIVSGIAENDKTNVFFCFSF